MDIQKLQRSFSIIDDGEIDSINEAIDDDHLEDGITENRFQDEAISDLSDFEENSSSQKRQNKLKFPSSNAGKVVPSLSSPGASFKLQSATRREATHPVKMLHISSDSEDSENEDKRKETITGEYDPKLYENLDVDKEVRDVFQFISKYIPQNLNLDTKLKPFIPEFLPAVGDIDAFLKVVPPEKTLTGEKCGPEQFSHLGLKVLDEPATHQSDPALLYLQLRATSVTPGKKNDGNAVVKKVDNTEQNAKIIEKWIKDISDLHKTKSSPVVRYSEPMPELDDLMQEWPEEMESKLKSEGFPEPNDMSLSEYIDTLCNLFQIPSAKKKIHSIHLLLCLYAAIKQTQFYRATSVVSSEKSTNASTNPKQEADQYIPQNLNLDTKLKPFIPEFLPAVGDIDAFLKVVPPEKTLTGEKCGPEQFSHLGLKVLDEPATHQSDPALLYLQLRATSVTPGKKNDENAVVKKVDNTEQNAKIIEKWIKDISDLHKTKSSPVVRYSEPMPELDDLMQEWPEEMESKLKSEGFPEPNDMSLSEYIDTLCNLFQIPSAKKKIHSIHLLLCLYAAIKQTQFYRATSVVSNEKSTNGSTNPKQEADQLVLE